MAIGGQIAVIFPGPHLLWCLTSGLPKDILSGWKNIILFFLQERKILHLLWWAVLGHNVQHYHAAQDAVLHRQLDHPLHGNLLLNSPHLLPAIRQWGEGKLTNIILFCVLMLCCSRWLFLSPFWQVYMCSSCWWWRSYLQPHLLYLF